YCHEMPFHRHRHRLLEMLRVREHFEQHVFLVHDADDRTVVEHRQLRHVVQLHAPICCEHRLTGIHRHGGMLPMPARDEVAQVPETLAFQEPLIEHPVVVVDLGKILVAAVADECDYAFCDLLLTAVAQSACQQGSGGCTGND